MQDLVLAETEKQMQEKRNNAKVEVETIQQQIEAKMNALKDQLAKTEGEITKRRRRAEIEFEARQTSD